MNISTPELKKNINKKVKYKVKGSSLYSYDTIKEVVRKNIIFEHDTRTFDQISEINLI